MCVCVRLAETLDFDLSLYFFTQVGLTLPHAPLARPLCVRTCVCVLSFYGQSNMQTEGTVTVVWCVGVAKGLISLSLTLPASRCN